VDDESSSTALAALGAIDPTPEMATKDRVQTLAHRIRQIAPMWLMQSRL
jgi:hypothetical protein